MEEEGAWAGSARGGRLGGVAGGGGGHAAGGGRSRVASAGGGCTQAAGARRRRTHLGVETEVVEPQQRRQRGGVVELRQGLADAVARAL